MTPSIGPLLIIGQGIAGTNLAWQCHRRGIPFTIADDGYKSASSLAAAGLYNPLILKRRKLTWRAIEFMHGLEEHYRWIEQITGLKCLKDIGIYRRNASIAEVNDWTALKDRSGVKEFLGSYVQSSMLPNAIDSPLGYQHVQAAGFVEVEKYLRASRTYFQAQGCMQERSTELNKETIAELLTRFNKVIVARGIRECEDADLFGQLPFSPAKGHSILIHAPNLELNSIVSGPCFIIPQGGNKYRIGSTYSWDNLNQEVEPSEVDKLVKTFESFCSSSHSIEEVWAGVRPATNDRKPLIGWSAEHSGLLIFNGFGSRAILSTPLLAEQLIAHLLGERDLWPEVDIARFQAK